MPRWYKVFSAALPWIGRFYGVCILAIGAVFLYLSGRGLIAMWTDTRGPRSDPTAYILGLIIAGLSFWAGTKVLRDRQLAKEYALGGKVDDEAERVLDEVNRLKESDPLRARGILEDYLAREDPNFERHLPNDRQ
jgi:hypothetical protein